LRRSTTEDLCDFLSLTEDRKYKACCGAVKNISF
jgi:hypothetical protein